MSDLPYRSFDGQRTGQSHEVQQARLQKSPPCASTITVTLRPARSRRIHGFSPAHGFCDGAALAQNDGGGRCVRAEWRKGCGSGALAANETTRQTTNTTSRNAAINDQYRAFCTAFRDEGVAPTAQLCAGQATVLPSPCALPTTVTLRPATACRTGSVAGSMGLGLCRGGAVDSAIALRLRRMTRESVTLRPTTARRTGSPTPSLCALPTTVTLRPATACRTGSVAGSMVLTLRRTAAVDSATALRLRRMTG